MRNTAASFPVDNSAILYLAQMGPDHTNVYRFTAALDEPVDSSLLQKAADKIYSRFPTIFAGFRPGIFDYTMFPSQAAPVVREDPGLLHVMPQDEIRRCAYRIFYSGCHVIIEAFHALTDGYGAIVSLKALLAEYVYLKHGTSVPERTPLWEAEPVWEEELRDAYPDHQGKEIGSLPRQDSYQLPGCGPSENVQVSIRQVSTNTLRAASKKHSISITSMLSQLMAESIMELQLRSGNGGHRKPVRIMVPVDLRNLFPSRTFRNFILYALPTMTPQELKLSRKERFHRFQAQLKQQTDKAFLKAQITRNVAIQKNLLYRILPLSWKCALLRLSYRFFGETNSSITLTNLGPIGLSKELQSHISWIQVYVMPRRGSPYNCGLISCGDTTSISITRFGSNESLADLFFEKLHSLLSDCSQKI